MSQSMLMEFDREMENTRKMLSAVPEGKWDWKPHEKSMSLAELAGHIATMTSWGKSLMQTDNLVLGPADYEPYLPASTADLVETFDKDKTEFRELLSKADDEAMTKIWSMTWDGEKVMEMPRVAALRGMIMNHMIHHRGQLTVYLRLSGAKVPGVYGPTADEKESTGT